MTVARHNFYQGDTLLNEDLFGTTYALRGLDSETEVDDLTVTSVSMAGVESDRSEAISGTTTAVPPASPEMAQEHKDAIDTIVANTPVSSWRTGVMLAVDSPEFGTYQAAYGTSDGTTPITLDMHFRVASITKPFTATAILMAVDRGLLSIDDPINKYLGNVPNGDVITIRMLLEHRSGLFHDQDDTNFAALFYGNPTQAYSIMSSLLFVRRGAPYAAPDTVYSYTNVGFLLAGMVLERVTGRKLKSLIEDDIMAPLGMTESSFPEYPTVDMPAPFSHGYGPNLLGQKSDWYRQNPNFIWGSGNIVSTIGDLMKWGKAMRDGTFLSPATHELWKSTFIFVGEAGPVTGPAYSYGLGLVRLKEWLGHDGSWPGYSSACAFHTQSGTVIVVMENAQTTGPPILTAWSAIMYGIADHFYPGTADEPTPEPPPDEGGEGDG